MNKLLNFNCFLQKIVLQKTFSQKELSQKIFSQKTRDNKKMKQIFKHSCMVMISMMLLLTSSFSSAEKVEVNFDEVDLITFIQTVSRITNKTIILGDRVKNKKINVISNNELSAEEIWGLFLSVLKLHNYSAVETDNIVKVDDVQNIKQSATPVLSTKGNGPADEQVTRVIKVKNVDVKHLFQTLRKLVGQKMELAQISATNVLVIHDTRSNVNRLVKIIKQIDHESNEEVEVIDLLHAAATDVVRIIETLQKNSGAAKAESVASQPKFVADERTNSILLSADKADSLRLKALIARLDTPTENAGNTKVIYLHYARAEDIANLLDDVGQNLQVEARPGSSPQAPRARRPNNRRRPGNNDKPYSIRAHEDTNSLVITAQPDVMRSFETVIRQLDIPRAQVHVEAIIVEMSDTGLQTLGVQLFSAIGALTSFSNAGASLFNVGAGLIALEGEETGGEAIFDNNGNVIGTNPVRDNGDNGVALAQALSGSQGVIFGYGKSDSSGDLAWGALVNALGTDTESNILSKPSITMLDNEEASLSVGQEVPFITGSTLGNNNSNPFQQVQREDVGIQLTVTPLINEGDSVRLVIDQEVSSLAGATGTDVVTNKRQIRTTVQVPDGGMVVLGGLTSDDIQQSTQKVPVLGDIPLLGRLFKTDSTTSRKQHLMVFIRPKILRDKASLHQLTQSKYDYIRAEQIHLRQKGVNLMDDDIAPVLPEFNEMLALPPSFEEMENKAKNTQSSDNQSKAAGNQ